MGGGREGGRGREGEYTEKRAEKENELEKSFIRLREASSGSIPRSLLI